MNDHVLLKKMTSILKDGIHVVNQDGITILYNRKIEIMENRAAADVMGKPLGIATTNNEMDEHLFEVLQTGMPQINQIYRGVNRYGNKIVGNVSIWPVTEKEKIIGAIKIMVDTTELRNLRARVLGITKDINQLTQADNAMSKEGRYTFMDIIGESPEMEVVKNLAQMAAKSDVNALITGASGTGKELIAQGIHNESQRKNKPLITENCAAIPENLAESILFGTVKGGFTGAVDRLGLFQLANGGTLILDEINSLPKGVQAKFLRVLQEGTFRPVGATEMKRVDVRVIGITNRNPQELIAEGSLRSDLFFRLGVITIDMPLLRDREGDLDLLAGYFLEKYGRKSGKWPVRISAEIKNAFRRFPWEGNVRELSNVIECGVSLVDAGKEIQMKHLPSYFSQEIERRREKKMITEEMEVKRLATGMNLTEYMCLMEEDMILTTLKKMNGNVSKTAEDLGITRQALQHKLRKIDLRSIEVKE